MTTWPAAELGDIARLRVLAAALPGVAVHERLIDAPFDEVWRFVGDLERSAPTFDRDVTWLRIKERDGDRLRIVAGGPSWAFRAPLAFEVHLRPGWCWMVGRRQLYVVGMAAEPDGERTRFAHLEGVGGAARWLRPVHAISRWRHEHHLPHDVDGIERALGLR